MATYGKKRRVEENLDEEGPPNKDKDNDSSPDEDEEGYDDDSPHEEFNEVIHEQNYMMWERLSCGPDSGHMSCACHVCTHKHMGATETNGPRSDMLGLTQPHSQLVISATDI